MTENALSILSVIFSVQLQQTEILERKLFIFHLGFMSCLDHFSLHCIIKMLNFKVNDPLNLLTGIGII